MRGDEPSRGQGVDGAVRILAGNGVGVTLLWALAAMLVVYGCYVFVEARYARCDPGRSGVARRSRNLLVRSSVRP